MAILKELKSRAIPIIIGVFLLIIIVYFGVSLYVAHSLTLIEPKQIPVSRESISSNSEDVNFKASDGTKLSGWLFKAESDKAIILVHGVGEVRTNEYYGGIEITKELLENNYNVLMYDTRGNGLSGEARLSFGQKEGKDIIGAINYLSNRGFDNKNIGIIADSLGAIGLLQSLNYITVGAIILDSPASEIEPIIKRELIETENIPEFMIPGIYSMAKTFFGLDIPSIRPIDRVYDKDKFLLFHGTADEFIPQTHSERILEKSHPGSRLVLFQNSDHIKGFIDHPELYKEEVLNYLEQELQQN